MSTHASEALQPSDLLEQSLQQGALLVDIRPRSQYRRAHVPGSASIPAGLLLAGEWPEGDLVLIGQDTAQANQLIEQLHQEGYNRRLRYLDGGFSTWISQAIDPQTPAQTIGGWLIRGRELVAGPALLLAAGVTQSLGLLALGLVLVLGPWTLRRSRA